MADFRNNQNLSLDGTDLLTLSACETGVGSNARDGREVDGLAMTAQLKGAKAVMSSLWDVSDMSTGQLMADFYKRWANGKGQVTAYSQKAIEPPIIERASIARYCAPCLCRVSGMIANAIVGAAAKLPRSSWV